MIDHARLVLEEAISHAHATTTRETDAAWYSRLGSHPYDLITEALRTGRIDATDPTVLDLLHAARARPPDVADAWQSRLQRTGRSDPSVLDLAAEALPQLAERVPATTPWRAESERLLPLLGAKRKAWSAELHETFETLLARAVRVRNAVLHGGAVPTASLASVDGFVAHLTQIINKHRVLALVESSSLLDVLEQVRVGSQLGAPPRVST